MQNVEFNYYNFYFPFLILSKFELKSFMKQPKMINLKIEIPMSNTKFYKKYAEFYFWLLFPMNKSLTKTSFFKKKMFFKDKYLLTNNLLGQFILINGNNKVLKLWNRVLLLFLNLVQDIYSSKLNTNKSDKIFSFKLKNVDFDNNLYFLLDLEPNFWNYYNILFEFYLSFEKKYHVKFFLENLNLPFKN